MSYVTEPARQIVAHDGREAIRAELEMTRHAFQTLVDSISEERWRRKSPSSAWSTGEVLVHLTAALEYLPREVESARRGKGMFNSPKWLADPVNYRLTRWTARDATQESIRQRYDAAMAAVLSTLDAVQESEWELGARFYGERFYTIADLFHTPAQHFAEHTAGMGTLDAGARAS
jgi:hypothetical protein